MEGDLVNEQWEYQIIRALLMEEALKKIGPLGLEGWEAVSMSTYSSPRNGFQDTAYWILIKRRL